MKYLFGYIACYVYLFVIILGMGLIQKLTHMKVELSRKIIHIAIGGTWNLLYIFFWDNWQTIIVPITFIIVNALSYKFKIFNGIEREDEEKNHFGTIYFAIAITILMGSALLFPSTIMASGIAVYCLCFGDGFAALIGTMVKKPIHITKTKSVQGTCACIIASFLSILLFSLIMGINVPVYVALIIGVATGILELVGLGLDNFSIVFGTYIIASLFINAGVIIV